MMKYLIPGLVVLLVSCRTDKKINERKLVLGAQTLQWYYNQKGELKFNTDMKAFFEAWKMGDRSKYLSDLSKETGFFTGMKRVDVIKYMGEDETRQEHQQASSLMYEMEGNCDDPEVDCCWIDFYFDEKSCVSLSA